MMRRVFTHYSTMREDMLEDTTRFVGWALEHPQYFLRIPRVRADSGITFSERFKIAFWSCALHRMRDIPYSDDD